MVKAALSAAVAVFVLAILARAVGLWSGPELEPAAVPAPVARVTPLAPPAAGSQTVDPIEPAWRRHAAAAPDSHGRARVVLVIDDLGLKSSATDRLAGMPGPLTLAFLPYSDKLAEQAARVRRVGHELIVHLPMAPKAADSDPGPMALLSLRDEREFARRLDWNLSRFSGFVGVNNHMGSRLTEDRSAMAAVMTALARRGLLFLDSRTTPATVAGHMAGAAGVPYAARDVFLDNVQDYDAIRARLGETEAVARETGVAVAIGHPYDVTLDAIEAWMTGLKARGLVLVPLSAVVRQPMAPVGNAGSVAASSG